MCERVTMRAIEPFRLQHRLNVWNFHRREPYFLFDFFASSCGPIARAADAYCFRWRESMTPAVTAIATLMVITPIAISNVVRLTSPPIVTDFTEIIVVTP